MSRKYTLDQFHARFPYAYGHMSIADIEDLGGARMVPGGLVIQDEARMHAAEHMHKVKLMLKACQV